MPLGLKVSKGSIVFRVYRGVGLERLLWEEGKACSFQLLLLSPRDPLAFVDSYYHRLEAKVPWAGECPWPDEAFGFWAACSATLEGVGKGFLAYRCSSFRRLAGEPSPAYSRVYGCIVELLVLHSKIVAGVEVGFDPVGYARGLAWCVERSAPERPELHLEAERLVRAIEAASKDPSPH